MEIKFFPLLLSLAYLTAYSAALDENFTKEHDKISMVQMAAEKPTIVRFVTPTKSPNVQVSATKHVTLTNNMEKVMNEEALRIEMPAIVDHPLQAVESKPVAITGFITTNGSIYEIEDKNGIGKIQSRQALDEEAQHICNYGAVVIYSDIPCEQVTNVEVREVGEKPALKPLFVMHQSSQSSEDDDNSNIEDTEDLETWQNASRLRAKKAKPMKKKKRPNQNRPKRPNPNGQKNSNKNKRPSKVQVTRPNKNKKRPNSQKRPSKGVQKKPNKTVQKRPTKGNKKRPSKDVQKLPLRTNNKNLRRWEEEEGEEEYDDDYDHYFENLRYREVEPYSSDY